jgi:putative nucleotidyltransferase with HDIG domain
LATAIAGSIAMGGLIAFAVADHDSLADPLTWILVGIAAVSSLLASQFSGPLTVSTAFLCGMLAVAFLGPAAAFLVVFLAEAVTWLYERYRWRAFLINLAGMPVPALVVAIAFLAADPAHESPAFFAALVLASVVDLLLNAAIVLPLSAMLDGRDARSNLPALVAQLPTFGISIVLALIIAEGYISYGLLAVVFLLVVVATAAYMSRLVTNSREQARAYANLSWGILSSLVRTLDERDHRAARHCAAVARFSRDIAGLARMPLRDQELAHTAGLLHDIGKFALSDRVMERGAELSEADWRGIRRHPDIGADLLRDIGVFGPVGEIVRCHHERLDGRGYPRGLTGESIPEVAKIVAVAEVYDTLTAPDTYRTPMNSFEALNELRRVSGTQLEGSYVELLAQLLSGTGTEYRHQDEASFDRELSMERRLSEAAAPT